MIFIACSNFVDRTVLNHPDGGGIRVLLTMCIDVLSLDKAKVKKKKTCGYTPIFCSSIKPKSNIQFERFEVISLHVAQIC